MYSDEDVVSRADGTRLDHTTGEVVSFYERELRKVKKPKKPKENSDDETEESEEELDENGEPIPKPKIFNELEIVKRVCDYKVNNEQSVEGEIRYY